MTNHTFTATCHTPGCGNAETPIECDWSEEFPPGQVFCGPCGQPITDLTGDLPQDVNLTNTGEEEQP